MDEFWKFMKAWGMNSPESNYFILHSFMRLESDEARARFILQCLAKHGKTVDTYREFKSTEKATEYIEEANKKFSSKLWKSLLDMYTRAVVHAPPNSSELARAYANRSVILYEEQMYEDSISDIERALEIGYPDERKAKLFVRKSRCLLALGAPNRKVADVMAEARKWTATMDDTTRKNLNKMLHVVPINSTPKRISNDDYYKMFPQNFGDNLKIIGASSAIEINYSEKFGRHIRATRAINAGETLLVHKAYASVIEPEFMLEYCWNCSRRAWAGVPCHECIAVIYCSEACRTIAWNDYHSVECPVIPLLLKFGMTKMFMILRLTIKAYKEAGTITKLIDTVTKIDAIQDPITKIYNGNMVDHTKYASVYTLLRGATCSLIIALQCMISLYCLGASTVIFGEQITNFQDLSINKSAIFMGELMLRHVRIFLINSFAKFIDTNTSELKYGTTMNPFINLFNHSCDPTAVLIQADDVIAVVAIERIEKGGQIYISYGPTFWQASIEDRRQFCKLYNFICECEPCRKGSGMQSVRLNPSHQFAAPVEHMDLLKLLTYLHALDVTKCDMNMGQMYLNVMRLSNWINAYDRDTKHSSLEYFGLKISLVQLLALICAKFQQERRSNITDI